MRILQTSKSLSVCALAGSLLFMAPVRIDAQDGTMYRGAFDAGVLMRSSSLDVRTQSARIAPEVAVDNRWLHVAATGAIAGSDLGWRVDQTALTAVIDRKYRGAGLVPGDRAFAAHAQSVT